MTEWVTTLANHSGIVRTIGTPPAEVTGVTSDSRNVQQGWVFFCVPGEQTDGSRFAESAVAAGAVGLVVSEQIAELDVFQIVVSDVRAEMGFIAATLMGNPSESLTVIGVTGTNGKSSVVKIIGDIVRASGKTVETVGTVSHSLTTPEATELQMIFAECVRDGVEVVAMEVSSHAMVKNRVDSISFDVAIFTNLSHDHLDFHSNMEDYFTAKASLFDAAVSSNAVICVDDDWGKRLYDRRPDAQVYSVSDVSDVVFQSAGSKFTWRGHDVQLSMIGSYNIANALAAAEAALIAGFEEESVVAGLNATEPVAGRMELVVSSSPIAVIVDYAHTPDAIDRVLAACREAAGGNRVIVVFGCGGERDKRKRPLMGKTVEVADIAILTNDNPRSEDPSAIAKDVLAGNSNLIVELDRRKAIKVAIELAENGDVVVICGKGHETVQIIGDEAIEFSDTVAAKEAMRKVGIA